MIDVVTLNLPQAQFEILNHKQFKPPSSILYKKHQDLGKYFQCVQNISKTETKYYPNLTVYKGVRPVRPGGYAIELNIKFSVPKLIFGNNFDECTDNDFPHVIDILHQRLQSMSIRCDSDALTNAKVTYIEYSKNVVLEKYISCTMVMQELRKIDLGKRLDLRELAYVNGGEGVKWHNNSRELMFYDKIKDLLKAKVSEKRAVEDDNSIQFPLLKKFPSGLEVLRDESRLSDGTVINSTLNKLGINTNRTFKELFNSQISRAVLLNDLIPINKELNTVLLGKMDVADIFNSIKRQGIPTMKASELCGVISLMEEIGQKMARSYYSDSQLIMAH